MIRPPGQAIGDHNFMSKRAKILGAAALLMLTGGLLALYCWPQPTYQGRTLRWWLEQQPLLGDLEAEIAQGEAIRHFGSAAIPVLLSELKETTWPARLRLFDEWLYEVTDRQLKVLENPPAERVDPIQGFTILGELADPAVPKLLQLAQAPSRGIGFRVRCSWALAGIGTTNAWNALGSLLTSTNATHREPGMHWLVRGQVSSRHMAPTLAKLVMDPDPRVAFRALEALAAVSEKPELVVPLLTNALVNADYQAKWAGVLGLPRYGTTAAAAAPTLSNMLPSATAVFGSPSPILHALDRIQCEVRQGAIVRGPQSRKQIALIFTGHEFAEGGEAVLGSLKRHHGKASFFLTGSFLTNAVLRPLIQQMRADRHYVGIHSDQHLLYCSWDRSPKTLVTRWQFEVDVKRNLDKLDRLPGRPFTNYPLVFDIPYFVPSYEHWNLDIADWSRGLGLTLVSYTPGTRANADYTEDGAANFVSSLAIFDSILARERDDPHGLNGFLLLLHLGAGPKRTDKFHTRFDELLTVLAAKGYQFVRVDELLNPPPR